jgi:aquaporin Z
MTGGFGANGLAGVGGSFIAGLVVEIVLTFIFVLTILCVTDSKYKNGRLAGLVIGFTLVLVHILGIGLTGTSVNPARSLGPAVFAAFTGNSGPIISQCVFIVGPLVGAALAAICYNFLTER